MTGNEAAQRSKKNANSDILGYYHLVRSQIMDENKLINQRLTWLLASQAFLFAAYGLVLQSIENDAARDWFYVSVSIVLCLLGVIFSISSLVSIRVAEAAMQDLLREAESKNAGFWQEIERTLPRIQYVDTSCIGWFAANRFLPVVLLIAWPALAALTIIWFSDVLTLVDFFCARF